MVLKFSIKNGTEKKITGFGSAENPKNDKYDERGNKIEWILYNPDGSISSKHEYKYDLKNNKIEDKFYNGKGELLIKEEFDYDSNNNQIRSESYENDTLSFFKSICKFDSLNNKIEWIGYKYHNFSGRVIYKYDSINRKSEVIDTDSLGTLINKTVYLYSQKNELLEENKFNNENKVINRIRYEYIYDNFGTWIEQKTYENDKLNQIIERRIKYFD